MDFQIPAEITAYLAELDAFIEREIKPLERENDNIRFFDHRREWARTDFENGGLPRHEWEELLREMRRRADKAGHYRYALPREYGGKDGTNLAMAIIREHLAAKGLGLHNDLQNESSIVGNLPTVLMFRDFGTAEQKKELIPEHPRRLDQRIAFGLTEPDHGSDATWMETRARARRRRMGDQRRQDVEHRRARRHARLHLRAHQRQATAAREGITCFIVPTNSAGLQDRGIPVDLQHADRPSAHLADRRSGSGRRRCSAIPRTAWRSRSISCTRTASGRRRRRWARRSSASTRAVKYAKERKPFGKPLATNQAIQWPLVELQTEAAMLRDADSQDRVGDGPDVQARGGASKLSDKVSMCNYRANRLVCEAADRAMQVHGGIGYSRHKPFEHIYRHHRRYRITEGAEEIQMRRVAQILFGFGHRAEAQK